MGGTSSQKSSTGLVGGGSDNAPMPDQSGLSIADFGGAAVNFPRELVPVYSHSTCSGFRSQMIRLSAARCI